MILKPTKVHANLERKTSLLYFGQSAEAWHDPTEYMMRGGVCWPITVERKGQVGVEGFILLAGVDVKTGKVVIFEQKPFVVVENLLAENGAIQYPGITEWLNNCWSKYYARKFYWHQDDHLTKKFRLEVSRSVSINPKPQFIKVEWSDIDEIKHVVWRYVQLKRITYDSGSPLHKDLQSIKEGEKQTLPAVHALCALLAGIERHPFRGA